jgi:hypothetical protein
MIRKTIVCYLERLFFIFGTESGLIHSSGNCSFMILAFVNVLINKENDSSY